MLKAQSILTASSRCQSQERSSRATWQWADCHKKMNLKLCEPLRLLFRDEVRRVGRELGMPEHLIGRHPFPGPGLAVRILGDITREKVEILQNADDIFIKASATGTSTTRFGRLA